jgi:2,3-bisphosphoglycerate-dependent phosphoglycerate mutase
MPYWEETIRPELVQGKKVCIAGHHNSLRAIVKGIESITDEGISDVILPTGVPLMYVFDDAMTIKEKKFLGDPLVIKAAIDAVNNQGKQK